MADATTLRILGDLVQPGDTVHALDRMTKRSGLMNTVDLFTFGIFTDAERFSNLGRRWVLVSQGERATLVQIESESVVDFTPLADGDPSRRRLFKTFEHREHRYRVMHPLS